MKKETIDCIPPNKDVVQIDREKLMFKIAWILGDKPLVCLIKERNKRVII